MAGVANLPLIHLFSPAMLLVWHMNLKYLNYSNPCVPSVTSWMYQQLFMLARPALYWNFVPQIAMTALVQHNMGCGE